MIQNKKKVIWITGGGTGIGKELAKKFSDRNFNVVISGRRIEKLNEVKKYSPKTIFPMRLDVTNPKKCKDVSRIIMGKFGFIDIIILNAATYSPGSLDVMKPREIKKILDINILGPIYCFAPVLENMKKESKGHLVFMSSPAGFRGLPGAGIYGVTKSALTFLAETLKIEYDKFKIKVQVIHPGFVKTAMTDKNNFEMPFLMTAEKAAEIITQKLFSNTFEISFPKKLIIPMKIMNLLPSSIYFFLIKYFVKQKKNG